MFAEYPARCLCGCEHHRVRRFGWCSRGNPHVGQIS